MRLTHLGAQPQFRALVRPLSPPAAKFPASFPTCEDREGLPADEQPPLLPSLVPGMSFTAQCTPSSRASGASSALGLPKPLCLKRKGVDLAHACDTANHSIVCVCFSCCGWKPNETALAADPGKLEER